MEQSSNDQEGSKTWFKRPEFWLKLFAYALPIGFLLYVLYWNFLPFGYDKTFTIQVGSASDTSGEFHLEPSRDLSERQTAPDGTTYRELNGAAYLVLNQKIPLKNALGEINLQGEGVSVMPAALSFDPTTVDWNNSWDFTQASLPKGLIGNAFLFDGLTYFNGKSRLELPFSFNKFENGPFSVYAEWQPENSTDSAQEIIGHYNWEIWQNSDSVEFRLGRMNNANGPFYSIKYPVAQDFFEKRHTALAIYSPSPLTGFADFFVDNNYVGRIFLGSDIIWTDYNTNRDLTFGKSDHGSAKYFQGYLIRAYFSQSALEPGQVSNEISISQGEIKIPIVGLMGKLTKITLHVKER